MRITENAALQFALEAAKINIETTGNWVPADDVVSFIKAIYEGLTKDEQK